MEPIVATRTIGGTDIRLEAGKLAMLAQGSAVVTIGETQVLVTCTSGAPREGIDFFPLTVDVEERMYAAGKIPGGFFRREGRPSETAILTARLIDRPLRPTFRKGFRQEVHVVCTVLSADQANPYDIPGINGAGLAAMLAGLPFDGPVAAVRVALMNGRWKVNPTYQDADLATFDMVVAGRRNQGGGVDILMVEAEAPEGALDHIADGAPAPTEEVVTEGLEEAKRAVGDIIDLQEGFIAQMGTAEREFPVQEDYEDEVRSAVDAFASGRMRDALQIAEKQRRNEAIDLLKDELGTHLAGLWEEEQVAARANQVARYFKDLQKDIMRRRVIEEGVRMDGRRTDEIRPITCEVGMVPKAHGSGLFQRGETQVLNVTTLGMLRMTQMIDTLDPEESKRYIHHYNFPPFSTGETGFMRGPKRREIGHGALAERALVPVIPSEDDFPYALRLVSDVLMSNGSTSMASVCASTLSLMDAGVPIKAPIAGIAMGLIAEGGEFVTLTDILGAEDALGDMDFKVAGTRDFITALQLDTKISGLPTEVLSGALKQAREARLHILDRMLEALPEPRELSAKAPRVLMKQIPVDKIGEVIGPKGKRINEIIAMTGADIDIEDDGRVFIGSREAESAERAVQMIDEILNPRMPEIGERFKGKVVKTTTFGAFVNIMPGTDGLVHISELRREGKRVESVEDVVNVGDELDVVVVKIEAGLKPRIGLRPIWPGEEPPSPEQLREEAAREQERGGRPRGERRDRGDRDRGDRGGRRDRDERRPRREESRPAAE
ncbi:MAG TPA: polyribonucleotide nucleotidyltransferase [Actinomycetota bacterium]|nr:polyribonucleotide nucleotidyltransferase [Actinomycetota bacterium]